MTIGPHVIRFKTSASTDTIYRLRKTPLAEWPYCPRDLLAAIPYTPPATLAQIHHALITTTFPLSSFVFFRMAKRLSSFSDDCGCYKQPLEVHQECRLVGPEDS